MKTEPQQYRVTKDGTELLKGTHNECFEFILKHQGQSVHYATTYAGYAIEEIKDYE